MTARAACRVCLADRALTRRGLIWHHHAAPLPDRCPGAGLPPWGAPSPTEPGLLPGQQRGPSPLTREHEGAGTVYLVHFAEPFGHARHYLGWSGPGNLAWRLACHEAGTGANLLRHVGKAGIGWELARTWPGDRRRERSLKARGHARACPICHPPLGAWLAAQQARRALHPTPA